MSKQFATIIVRFVGLFALLAAMIFPATPAAAQSNEPKSVVTEEGEGVNAANSSGKMSFSTQAPAGNSVAAASAERSFDWQAPVYFRKSDQLARPHLILSNKTGIQAGDIITGTVGSLNVSMKLNQKADQEIKIGEIPMAPNTTIWWHLYFNGTPWPAFSQLVNPSPVIITANWPDAPAYCKPLVKIHNDPGILAVLDDMVKDNTWHDATDFDLGPWLVDVNRLKHVLDVQAAHSKDADGNWLFNSRLHVEWEADCGIPQPEKAFRAHIDIDCAQNFQAVIDEQKSVQKIAWTIDGQPVAEPKGNLGTANSAKISALVTYNDATTASFDYTASRKTDCPVTTKPNCSAVQYALDKATMMATVSAQGVNSTGWEIYETATGTVVAKGDGNNIVNAQFKAKYDTNYAVRFVSADGKVSDGGACSFSFAKEKGQSCPPGKVRTRDGSCESPYDIYVKGFAKSACPNPQEVILTFEEWGVLGHKFGWDYDQIQLMRADPVIEGWNQNDIEARWPSIYEQTGWNGRPFSVQSVYTYTWDYIHETLGDPSISAIKAWNITISKSDHHKPGVTFVFKTPVEWIQGCTVEKKPETPTLSIHIGSACPATDIQIRRQDTNFPEGTTFEYRDQQGNLLAVDENGRFSWDGRTEIQVTVVASDGTTAVSNKLTREITELGEWKPNAPTTDDGVVVPASLPCTAAPQFNGIDDQQAAIIIAAQNAGAASATLIVIGLFILFMLVVRRRPAYAR